MLLQADILELFKKTRKRSEEICSFLETEDFVVQPVVDVSPPKWHLGHTTWFFEQFVLEPENEGYQVFDGRFAFVFNSYYESVGKRVIRTDRGNLSRPTVSDVMEYRRYVDRAMAKFLQKEPSKRLREVIELGIHHEKQHQELLLTDIKYILGNNPLFPHYNDSFEEDPVQDFPQEWLQIPEGIYKIGHRNKEEFCFDNELRAHKTFLHPFELSNKLVTNGEFLEFIEDKGYDDPLLWHSEGWEWKNLHGISAPFYWHKIDGKWMRYTLQGLQPIIPDAPLAHISFYEAFAYAEWKGMRLPTEFEWEAASEHFDYGSRWEWTQSAYAPYPGYSKAEGALGEYNGKFMVNQKVLRGGSVASAPEHIRCTYRNFFHPPLRWQFTGIRLAK